MRGLRWNNLRCASILQVTNSEALMTDINTTRQSSFENDALNCAKQAASSAAETVSNLAGQATDFAGKAASALASDAEQKASGLMHQQMLSSAQYVQSISQTAHTAARELEDQAPEIARIVHDVADRAEHFANGLRNSSPDEILDAALTYARGNPRVFLGGAIAVGFLLARFAKTSSERSASARHLPDPMKRPSDFASKSSGAIRGGESGHGGTGNASQSDRPSPAHNSNGGASYAG
jgi:ElaB/YqjD/DUF883 family membrane-anchored ribosome-binding protein